MSKSSGSSGRSGGSHAGGHASTVGGATNRSPAVHAAARFDQTASGPPPPARAALRVGRSPGTPAWRATPLALGRLRSTDVAGHIVERAGHAHLDSYGF